MSGVEAFRYRAFISYSHRDSGWAAWLHGALESYRIAGDLAGRSTVAGPIPKTLRPVFRDREDFAAGHSLTEQTLAALQASECLIVLCSPHAALSPYVNEEIRVFKTLGRGARVIPVIVAGQPGAGPNDCFPPALRQNFGPDGAPAESAEPIAADARAQGDGRERAKLKIIAAMLGVGLDEIVRRADQARRRRNRIWGALAGALVSLAVAAGGSGAYAWQQLKTNEAFLNATLQTATEIVETAVTQAERHNVPRTATLELLRRAERLFADMSRLGRSTPELRYRRATMLIAFARNYAILGDTEKQRERITEAHALMLALVAEFGSRTAYQADLAVTHSELANVLMAQGSLADALEHYRACLTIMLRLTAAEPGNAGWQRDVATSQVMVAVVLITQGKLAEALEMLHASLAIRERLAAAYPNDAGTLLRLSASHAMACFVTRTQGRVSEALDSCRASLTLRERVVAGDPQNLAFQAELALAHQQMGIVLAALGDRQGAIASQRAGLAIWARLAAADPNNAGWQNSVAGAHDSLGRQLAEQGQHEDALVNLRASLAIMLRLTAADPRHIGWRRDLAVVHGRIGVSLQALGRVDEALASLGAALTVFERLAATDPSNTLWQHDLFVAYAKLAEISVENGRPVEARGHFRAALSIIERLVAKDPTNSEWQIDLIDANLALARLGDEAPRRFALVVKALHALAVRGPLLPEQARSLAEAEAELRKADSQEVTRPGQAA